MNSTNDATEQIATLTELGLTTTQAKIYLTLVKTKNLTAQAISVISSVSRPDVYRVLNELQEAGLVEKIIAKPEEFQAITIEECVSILIQKRTRHTVELQSRGLALVQSVKQRADNAETAEIHKSEFIFIPSKGTAYSRVERMLKNTQKSIYFVGLTKRMSSWLAQYSVNMEDALTKNIDCRIILPELGTKKFSGPFKVFQRFPNFSVRTIPGSPKASFSIWDKKEILIITSIGDIPFPSGTLWSSNKGLIDLCADYFEFLWQKAEKTSMSKV